jgi:rhomboid-like protein
LAPAASVLAAACVFFFFVVKTTSRFEFIYGFTYSQALVSCFGLNWAAFSHGFFWQPLTYLFLHANGWHLAFNALTILLFGSGVEREIGPWRFWWLFLGGGVLAGLGWFAATWLGGFFPPLPSLAKWLPEVVRHAIGAGEPVRQSLQNGLLIGASGGVFALIGAYAALFPKRDVYVLLVVFPVRLHALTLALVFVGIDLAAALFLPSQIANSAHLCGCAAGYVFGLGLRREFGDFDESP